MNRKIYKYRLKPMSTSSKCSAELPKNAVIRHFGCQNNQLYVWAEVDPEAETENVVFVVHATGEEVTPFEDYIGTTFMGPFVLHLYVVTQ